VSRAWWSPLLLHALLYIISASASTACYLVHPSHELLQASLVVVHLPPAKIMYTLNRCQALCELMYTGESQPLAQTIAQTTHASKETCALTAGVRRCEGSISGQTVCHLHTTPTQAKTHARSQQVSGAVWAQYQGRHFATYTQHPRKQRLMRAHSRCRALCGLNFRANILPLTHNTHASKDTCALTASSGAVWAEFQGKHFATYTQHPHKHVATYTQHPRKQRHMDAHSRCQALCGLKFRANFLPPTPNTHASKDTYALTAGVRRCVG